MIPCPRVKISKHYPALEFLQRELCANVAMLQCKTLNHTCIVQMTYNYITESVMYPVMELIFEKDALSRSKNPEK